MLLAIGYSLWAFHQFLDLYYELGLHVEVPNNSIADPVLFLHLVPIMAAVAIRPHWNGLDRKLHRWILDSLLLIAFWVFLYVFTIVPYQYLFWSASSYGFRFDLLYAIANFVLVLTIVLLTFRAKHPWKLIYLHLFGACGLYALSSTVANLAIDTGGYVNGKLYGLGLTASVCWFVWVP